MRNNKQRNRNACPRAVNSKTLLPNTAVDEKQSRPADCSERLGVTPRKERVASGDRSNTALEVTVSAQTASEKLMASIWAEILNLKEIGMHDNFFDHGRDSYLAIEVVARVRKIFAVNLSVRALFEDPTVAGMTTAVLKSQNLESQISSLESSSRLWSSRKQPDRLDSKAKRSERF